MKAIIFPEANKIDIEGLDTDVREGVELIVAGDIFLDTLMGPAIVLPCHFSSRSLLRTEAPAPTQRMMECRMLNDE